METTMINEVSAGGGIGKFIWKNWLLILTIILLLPVIISTVSYAIKENNYLYPVYTIGSTIISADNVLYQNVLTLENNPDKLIGMQKPDSGIWKHAVYYWLFFFNVIWNILLEVHLIFLPFVVVYWLFKSNNSTTTGKNMMMTLVIVISLMFFMNSIFTITGILNGTISIKIPSNLTPFEESIFITENLVPFHGLGKLIFYIGGLFIN